MLLQRAALRLFSASQARRCTRALSGAVPALQSGGQQQAPPGAGVGSTTSSPSSAAAPTPGAGPAPTAFGYNIMNVFDRAAKTMQRDRAARRADAADHDQLRDYTAGVVVDRLFDITRRFPTVLDLGCGAGHIAGVITKEVADKLIQTDLSEGMLRRAQRRYEDHLREKQLDASDAETAPPLVESRLMDEEHMTFEPNSLDAVVSSLSLHWVNDLPGVFRQLHRALKPDGAFVGAMFGTETLRELRSALQVAEQERRGGFHPHISPFTDSRDIGNLLTRAGFTLTTIDVDEVTISYPSMMELMLDLQGMAENNASWNRVPFLNRESMLAAGAIYQHMYGTKDAIPASFQIVHFIGWKPSPNQPKPAKRGSATASFANLDQLSQQQAAPSETPKS
ncbi:methyltransferase [Capsaspora owczarzaki ATCC 30864]|nr:methyltransferase [Capsaspora owczarzaki ATCC 30864]|eukprot:XP_004346722.2 methyltransferase [Capsaspora owczarzaki ATCC 30864]